MVLTWPKLIIVYGKRLFYFPFLFTSINVYGNIFSNKTYSTKNILEHKKQK